MSEKRGVGRPKGSKSMTTQVKREDAYILMQIHMLNKHGLDNYDPLIELIEAGFDRKNTTLDQRIRCNTAVLPYLHAQKQSIRVGGDPDNPIELKMSLMDKIIQAIEGIAVDVTPEIDLDLDRKSDGEKKPK